MRLIAGLTFAFLLAASGILSAGDKSARVGYEYWIPNSETDSAAMHGIHFREFVNGSARRPPYEFHFQRQDEPQLDELRQRLGLDELVNSAKDDLEAAARIALKVCNLWAHSAPVEYPSWNALGLLDRVSQGEQYWCTYKQLVTMQALASIGLVSRIVPCHWHHSHEFWSNDYGRWILLDAWTANYYRKDGVPLGTEVLLRMLLQSAGRLGAALKRFSTGACTADHALGVVACLSSECSGHGQQDMAECLHILPCADLCRRWVAED